MEEPDDIVWRDFAQYYPAGALAPLYRLFIATRYPGHYYSIYKESAKFYIEQRKERFRKLGQKVPFMCGKIQMMIPSYEQLKILRYSI